MRITAELSLYPLRQPDPMPTIDGFVKSLRAAGLEVDFGPMSSAVSGDAENVFDAVKAAYRQAAAAGPHVLVMKISNVSPSHRDAE